jgi:anti-sigma regulatory factor (Ser/Thr protein kinase)
MAATGTTSSMGHPPSCENAGFRHEALLYAGMDDFVDRASAFIRDGVVADEPVLVVVGAAKIDLLRMELGPAAAAVNFADMADVGANPARIIPAWREFVDEQAAWERPVRGIGEPIWAARPPAELVESQRHEALLNVAFADDPQLWLVCPYDTESLPPDVVDEARRAHPLIRHGDEQSGSDEYLGDERLAEPFDVVLPAPPPDHSRLAFGNAPLSKVRAFVSARAAAAGLEPEREGDLLLAVTEMATNSLRHGGGKGTLRVWEEGDSVVCEVSDQGRIDDPLVGRVRPAIEQEDGRGLWIANQLCDLVQVRTFAAGTTVRLHMKLA